MNCEHFFCILFITSVLFSFANFFIGPKLPCARLRPRTLNGKGILAAISWSAVKYMPIGNIQPNVSLFSLPYLSLSLFIFSFEAIVTL